MEIDRRIDEETGEREGETRVRGRNKSEKGATRVRLSVFLRMGVQASV
jgi:hypothetical protein